MCHQVLPPNAIAWSSGHTHIKFFHRFPVNAARSIDSGRKRGTKCKFSAHGQGLALAVIQRQSAGRTQCETPTQSVPPSPSSQRFAWSSGHTECATESFLPTLCLVVRTHAYKVFTSFPVNAARSIDYGRKRGTKCKFSAHGQGLALAVIQRQSAGRTQCETPTQSVPYSPSFQRIAWSSSRCCCRSIFFILPSSQRAVMTMAENAARSASFLLTVKGSPLPWCSGGTLLFSHLQTQGRKGADCFAGRAVTDSGITV